MLKIVAEKTVVSDYERKINIENLYNRMQMIHRDTNYKKCNFDVETNTLTVYNS